MHKLYENCNDEASYNYCYLVTWNKEDEDEEKSWTRQVSCSEMRSRHKQFF